MAGGLNFKKAFWNEAAGYSSCQEEVAQILRIQTKQIGKGCVQFFIRSYWSFGIVDSELQTWNALILICYQLSVYLY
jgi:hypothetical protein